MVEKAGKKPTPPGITEGDGSHQQQPRPQVERKGKLPSPEGHIHNWRIDEPNGPISLGTCKTCHTTKPFKNWLSDMDFITNTEHQEGV